MLHECQRDVQADALAYGSDPYQQVLVGSCVSFA
jgi:hypothetical protein